MKKLNNISLSALILIGAFFSLSYNVLGQEKDFIELVKGADNITIDGKSNDIIITGHVMLEKDETTIYCDSAYYNALKNKVYAYGRIHLNKQDTLNMYCDSLHYNLNNDFAKLYSNVRIRDNEYKLTTDSIGYNLKENFGVYLNGGLITSITSKEQLSSKVGYFYPNLDQFNFRDSVIYKNEDYTVNADTLEFNGQTKIAYFFGPTTIEGDSSFIYCEKGWYNINNDIGVLEQNAYIQRPDIYIGADSLYFSAQDSIYIGKYHVDIRDTANNIAFRGDYAINNGKIKRGLITGHALALQYDEKDTLYIHADTLFNILDSINQPKIMLAYPSVTFFRGEMQGRCDSLVFNKKNGIMNLFYEPILWAKMAQLSSDTITIYEKDNEIRRAYLRKQALIITHVDSTKYYNQVSGTNMNAYFDSTEIRRVDISGNAKTIYFLEQEDENDTTIIITRKGMNRLYSSTISLGFEDGDIITATYRNKPDGVLYPMTQINKKEERVESFKWKPELRPISWQAMILSKEEKKFYFYIFHWAVNANPFISVIIPQEKNWNRVKQEESATKNE